MAREEVTAKRDLEWRTGGLFGENERRVAVRGWERNLEEGEDNAIGDGIGVAIFGDLKLSQ